MVEMWDVVKMWDVAKVRDVAKMGRKCWFLKFDVVLMG
jgi:hypothetical protein